MSITFGHITQLLYLWNQSRGVAWLHKVIVRLFWDQCCKELLLGYGNNAVLGFSCFKKKREKKPLIISYNAMPCPNGVLIFSCIHDSCSTALETILKTTCYHSQTSDGSSQMSIYIVFKATQWNHNMIWSQSAEAAFAVPRFIQLAKSTADMPTLCRLSAVITRTIIDSDMLGLHMIDYICSARIWSNLCILLFHHKCLKSRA